MKKKIVGMILLLTMIVSVIPTKAAQNKGYMFPIPDFIRISQGYAPSENPTHYAIDIAANELTPIYATKSGTINKVYTGCTNSGGAGTGGVSCSSRGGCNPNYGTYSNGYCNYGCGNGIIIKHDDDIWSEYSHMASVASGIYEGQHVEQGTLIGYVGNTGYSAGNHCHFAMASGSNSNYWSNSRINPLNYMDTDDKGDIIPSQINWPDVSAGTASTDTVISWSAATNATDYDVYIYVQGSSEYYHFGNTTSTSYSVVLPEGTYEVEIVSCNKSNGSNIYAGNAHRTTFTVTPAVPSQVNWPDVIAGTSKTNTYISWSAATNATDYDVYIYVQGSSEYYQFGNTASTSYSIVLPAATYEVEIVACNKSGDSNVYAGNAHRTTFTVTEANASPTPTITPTPNPMTSSSPTPISTATPSTAPTATPTPTPTATTTPTVKPENDYAYEITLISLTDMTGETVTSVPVGSGFIVETELKKTKQRSERDYIFVAVYDENNALLSLDFVKASFVENQTYSIGFNIPPQSVPIGNVKAFVWNSFNGAEPLAKTKALYN